MNGSQNENLIGFASLMHNQFVRPLENSEKFKERYKDVNLQLFFNITDASHSAVLILKNGIIDIEGIAQVDKDELEKARNQCDAMVETDMKTFVTMNDMSMIKTLGKIISGKLKIKGGKHLKLLQELRVLAEEEDAQDFF
ncbi:MAG: hypothetical protein HWN80_12970 [Candidatus Lokiarchaeota archaeon]|nr:hypothetical protein [Candidatus Lokiarchaeota archaeon]